VWSSARTRADFFSISRHDYDVEVGSVPSNRPADRVLRVADLVVEEERPGALIVRTLDGRERFDLIAFVEHHLIAESHGRFRIFQHEPHRPRVTIDRLVISREQWSMTPDGIPFAGETDRYARFAGARRWAQEHGIPERVFYKVLEEPKPCYLDLASPILVDIFCKIVRKATQIEISEMLPEPDACWLRDREGRRYTSELRIAAVDPVSYQPAVDPMSHHS
jgi:hypothetical protein